MENAKTIDFSIIEFSQSPGPRYCSQGDDSGELFYHQILNQKFAEAYQAGNNLRVILDGADGYASSFLDEAFGNLVYDFGESAVRNTLIIVSEDEEVWITMISNETIPEWERRRKDSQAPKMTTSHDAWYRIVDGNLTKSVWK